MHSLSGNPQRELNDLIDQVKQQGVPGFQMIHGLDRLNLLRWSDRMVEAYGKVFQKNKALIMDELLLPCPKEDLKVALKVEFYAFALKQNEDAMEDLTHAYLNISRFQSLPPNDKAMLKELNLHAVPMMDLGTLGHDREVLSEQERRFMKCFRTLHAYLGSVEKEKENLKQDFDRFVHALFGPDTDQR